MRRSLKRPGDLQAKAGRAKRTRFAPCIRFEEFHLAHSMRSLNTRDSGTTLIELVAVASILAILAAIVLVRPDAGQAHQLESAAQEIAAALRFAQAEAMRSESGVGLQIESSAGRLRLFSLDESATPAVLRYDVRHPLSGHTYEVSLRATGTRPGVGFAPVMNFDATCDDATLLLFDGDAMPRCLEPRSAHLVDAAFALQHGSASLSVRVDGVTGRTWIQ